MESDRDPRIQALMLALSVLATAAMVWMELPPDQRAMMLLTARSNLQKFAHRAARRAGHAGMGSELNHWPVPAQAGYGLAYRFSRLRDRL